jgi:DNA modification methylase
MGDSVKFALRSDTLIKKKVNFLKELGKNKDINNSDIFIERALNDKSSIVRREATSSLGRLRDPKYKNVFVKITSDKDPKVVMQAIRALLAIGVTNKELRYLESLKNHKNEMIQASIRERQHHKTGNKNHKDHPGYLTNVTVNASTIEVMELIEDESVHLTFTSPPYYNARDYSFYESYEDYLDFLEACFKSVHRITKEGRFLIVNTSPIIVPRLSRQHSSKRYPIPFDLHNRIINNGWEFIDDIIWLKPEYSVKNRVGGFQQHRKPLGYKPNTTTEMLMVYRKKTDKLLDWNIRSYDLDIVSKSLVKGEFETTNVWKINPKSSKDHTAIFPKELCERVISYYSYVGDLVYDPFAGSGTFGATASKMGRNFFMTELDKGYFNVIRKNFINLDLFQKQEPRFYNLEDFKRAIHDFNG